MKYLTNEDGSIKVGANGHPMVDPENGGAHHELDAINGVDVIKNLNTEAKNHRTEKKALKVIVDALPEEIRTDPTAAVTALQTVAGLDDKLKIDLKAKEEEVAGRYDGSIKDLNTTITSLTTSLHKEKVGTQFAKSEYIKTKLVLHPDLAESKFNSHFSLDENNNIVAKDYNEQQIFSKVNPGQAATFDEAIAHLVETSPIKDHMLKAGGGSGDGSRDGGGGGGGDTIQSRSSKDNIKEGLKKL